MNHVGMIVDCSHMSERSSLDAINASATPAVLSHANPKSLTSHDRNVSDHLIKEIATQGGVICLNGVSAFLGVNESNVDTFLDHLCYVAELVGVEYVGIGLDVGFSQPELDDSPPPDLIIGHYHPEYWWPKIAGYQSGISAVRYLQPELWLALPHLLKSRGFIKSEVELILGENMMRVLASVETHAYAYIR